MLYDCKENCRMGAGVHTCVNSTPTAQVIWRRDPLPKASSNILVNPEIEPVTPALQCELFIHCTAASTTLMMQLVNTRANYSNVGALFGMKVYKTKRKTRV